MGLFVTSVVAVYVLVGLIVAAVFLSIGVQSVLPPSATMTRPARMMLLPGVVALWPYVLYRWLRPPARK